MWQFGEICHNEEATPLADPIRRKRGRLPKVQTVEESAHLGETVPNDETILLADPISHPPCGSPDRRTLQDSAHAAETVNNDEPESTRRKRGRPPTRQRDESNKENVPLGGTEESWFSSRAPINRAAKNSRYLQ